MNIQLAANEFYQYSLHMRGRSKDTIKRYKTVINFFCKLLQLENIEEVTDEKVRSLFFIGRTQRNWNTNTFICYHKSLLVFFRWCVQQRYMKHNPIEDIEVPKLEKRLPTKLTKQQALQILDVINNYPYEHEFLRYRNHAIFSMFLFAGLRKKELIKLRCSDVDVQNLSIFINQGKGSKDRIIPMSFTLARSLSRYREERTRMKKTCPEFFASFNRNMGFTETGLKRLVEKIRTCTKLSFTIHKLRHTFATLMLEGGCDIYSLSKMMGHSEITTTTIYLHASPEHLRSQMTKHPLNTAQK